MNLVKKRVREFFFKEKGNIFWVKLFIQRNFFVFLFWGKKLHFFSFRKGAILFLVKSLNFKGGKMNTVLLDNSVLFFGEKSSSWCYFFVSFKTKWWSYEKKFYKGIFGGQTFFLEQTKQNNNILGREKRSFFGQRILQKLLSRKISYFQNRRLSPMRKKPSKINDYFLFGGGVAIERWK